MEGIQLITLCFQLLRMLEIFHLTNLGGGEYILMLSSILHQSPKWDIWKENLIVNLNHYTLYPNGAHPRNASVI